MRALILNGSARPIGSTGNIVGDIIEELEKGGVETRSSMTDNGDGSISAAWEVGDQIWVLYTNIGDASEETTATVTAVDPSTKAATISLTLDGETLYTSKALKPGEALESITLEKPLAPGAYKALAVSTVYDKSGEKQLVTRVPVTLNVAAE